MRLFLLLMLSRVGGLLALNAALIALGCFYPKWAILLYIVLPLVSFFRAER